MSLNLDNLVEKFKEEAPKILKENKGAVVGAVIGYLLTDSKQAQSTLLGAIAGAVVVDNQKKEEE